MPEITKEEENRDENLKTIIIRQRFRVLCLDVGVGAGQRRKKNAAEGQTARRRRRT